MSSPLPPLQSADAAGFPEVAVVILNWNGQRYLEQFLPVLLQSTYPRLRIVVADNASTDGSCVWLEEKYPKVELLRNRLNEGFARGYNTALSQVQSDYYVLLNSDVEVTPGWIEPVVALMEKDRTIGACQPKIRSYTHREQFEYAGACGGWLDEFGYPFSRGRVFDYLEEDHGQYDEPVPCFWASGAAMFVRAELYHRVGGLDAYFFAHQEEIDFCWRLQLAGYHVFVQPASVVYHIGGGTLPKENNLKVFLNFRNNLVMLAKNLPLSEALWKIPMRMGLDAVAAWKGLLSGSAGYFIAIARAHVGFADWLLFKKHGSVFPPEKSSHLQGYYKGSAVWQHFVKKKTRFSEIVQAK